MKSYGHPNSSVEPPTLSDAQQSLYWTMRNGGTIAPATESLKFVAQDLAIVTEKLRCDAVCARFGNRIPWLTPGCSHKNYFTAAVSLAPCDVQSPDEIYCMFAVDSEAGNRIADRLDSGVSPVEAVLKTLAQCEQPVYTERELQRLEREADAHVRRVEARDRAIYG